MGTIAKKITLLGNRGDPIEVTVLHNVAIPKGTLMQLSSDPKTATASSAANEIFIGVLVEEKVSTDGITTVAVYTHGLFEMTTGVGDSAVLGGTVMLGGLNEITLADASAAEDGAQVVGISQETLGASASGVVKINVGKRY